MKKLLTLLLLFGIVSCDGIDLIDAANNERYFKITDIYDCRSQNRHPWGDSPHSQVHTYIIDITNKKGIKHTGYYKNTILNSAFDYKLKVKISDSYEYEQSVFDIGRLNESANFIRFTSFTIKGANSNFVIDKSKNTLSYIHKKNNALKEKISDMNELGFSEEWVLENLGLSWENNCNKI